MQANGAAKPKLFLASKSPRRAELLQQIGVPFEVLSIDVPEHRQEGEAPATYVARLAREKARAGAALVNGCAVLGADTIVECAGHVLEKPRDQAHAAEMLHLLSDQTHLVHTAVALCCNEQLYTDLVTSKVTFRALSSDEIARYWLTGEPADKAGGYGIQGLGAVFVQHLAGSYSGVMGLPIAQTQQLLASLNITCWQPDASTALM
ncbi:Maf family protein [Marinagarivorans cellulosilyticus]|uniref:dTTP/UTP pyrophosphatase n=1 Tax=Marinagarivorans cellulosilyticus TaxID=2721545 RepID=A0AAN2BK57_9GAMM|nr:Maf family protein [Marinagarivorans cellulosilyticus]BCD97654.1 septum formation protein [Marinagarivorans cellulosilyticus]